MAPLGEEEKKSGSKAFRAPGLRLFELLPLPPEGLTTAIPGGGLAPSAGLPAGASAQARLRGKRAMKKNFFLISLILPEASGHYQRGFLNYLG